jgi:hypothetical protein
MQVEHSIAALKLCAVHVPVRCPRTYGHAELFEKLGFMPILVGWDGSASGKEASDLLALLFDVDLRARSIGDSHAWHYNCHAGVLQVYRAIHTTPSFEDPHGVQNGAVRIIHKLPLQRRRIVQRNAREPVCE